MGPLNLTVSLVSLPWDFSNTFIMPDEAAIVSKGLGLLGKRKTLTVSGPSTSKKRTVVIEKPSTTKLADNWKDRRIGADNRKIWKAHPYAKQGLHEDYAQEVSDIYDSIAKTKKEYKAGKK